MPGLARRLLLLPALLALATACANTTGGQEAGAPRPLKHRVAVLRFENATDFATGAPEGRSGVPLEEQAAALLEELLRGSGQVVLIDARNGAPVADFVFTGTLSEFGTSTRVWTQLLRRSKRQGARAALRLQLVEVPGDRILATEEGRAEGSVKTSRLLGMGSDAPFDDGLCAEVLADALAEPAAALLERLRQQPWRTVVVALDGDEVVIAGGSEQGLRPGDRLSVRKRGRAVESPQLEGPLELPSTEVARLEVISSFGSGANHEGSLCRLLEGQLEGLALETLVVESPR